MNMKPEKIDEYIAEVDELSAEDISDRLTGTTKGSYKHFNAALYGPDVIEDITKMSILQKGYFDKIGSTTATDAETATTKAEEAAESAAAIPAMLADDNALDIIRAQPHGADVTRYDVTFSWQPDGRMKVSGATAAGNDNYPAREIYNNHLKLPTGIKAGKSYRMIFRRTANGQSVANNKLQLMIVYYKAGGTYTDPIYYQTDNTITIPADAIGIVIRFFCAKEVDFTGTNIQYVTAKILTAKTNAELAAEKADAEDVAALTEDVGDLSDALGETADTVNKMVTDIVDAYTYTEIPLGDLSKSPIKIDIVSEYITGNNAWDSGTNVQSYLISVAELKKVGCKKFKIQGRPEPQLNAFVSLLTSYNTAVAPVFAAGETGRRQLPYADITEVDIPADCKYILIGKQTNTPTNVKPDYFAIYHDKAKYNAIAERKCHGEQFTYGNLEQDDETGWYLIGGGIHESVTERKTLPIKIDPWQDVYYAGGNDGSMCAGAWLDQNYNWIAPIGVISPYRTNAALTGSAIAYAAGAVIKKDGTYYKCTATVAQNEAWDATKWEVIKKPRGYMEIDEYEIPQKRITSAVPVRRNTDNQTTATYVYADLWRMTPVTGAAYMVLNLHVNSAMLKNVQGISTKPIFVSTGEPNMAWRDDNILYSQKSDKKLCIIGQSGTMVGRLLRNLPDESGPLQPLVGFQEYLIPFYEDVVTYGYSGQNYMEGDGETIYDQIITGSVNLSGYDEFLLCLGGNDISVNNIGDDDVVADRTNVETFVGGLNAMLDYIFTQTTDNAVPPQIYIETYPKAETLPAYEAMNEQARKICKRRKVILIDRANESGINPETKSRQYYDDKHNSTYAMRVRGMVYRKHMIGF